MVRTQREIHCPNKFWSAWYRAANYRHYVEQQISRTHLPCITENTHWVVTESVNETYVPRFHLTVKSIKRRHFKCRADNHASKSVKYNGHLKNLPWIKFNWQILPFTRIYTLITWIICSVQHPHKCSLIPGDADSWGFSEALNEILTDWQLQV